MLPIFILVILVQQLVFWSAHSSSHSPPPSCTAATVTPITPPRILSIDVQGWGEYTRLPHSYAVVQRGLIGALTNTSAVFCHSCTFQHVKVIKSSTTPLYQPRWLSALEVQSTQDRLARTLHATTNTTTTTTTNTNLLDATLRFSFPFDLSPSPTSRHTFVFATTEYGNVSSQYMVQGGVDPQGKTAYLPVHPSVTIVTPSEWSRAGFLHAGISPERVLVLRHGVDFRHVGVLPMDTRRTARLVYFPSPSLRINALETVVYVHVGSMTYNKGFDVILSTFVQHYKSSPGGQHARLLLKGLDDMYNSRELLQRELMKLKELQHLALRLVASGIITYIGTRLSRLELNKLLCSADVYLTPYRAEGFNMPAQEAAACGLTVITTSLLAAPSAAASPVLSVLPYTGVAPTDDWCRPTFCKYIASTLVQVTFLQNQLGYMMAPNATHLLALLRETTVEIWRTNRLQLVGGVGEVGERRQHLSEGIAHLAATHTWTHVGLSFLSEIVEKTIATK